MPPVQAPFTPSAAGSPLASRSDRTTPSPIRPVPEAPGLARPAQWFLMAAFLTGLALPCLGLLAGVGRNDARGENRQLAPFPSIAWSWAAARALPDGFLRYVEDHFAFRTALVQAQATIRYRWLRVSPTPTVVRGRDGWQFYADDDAMADYISATPFTRADLDAWQRALVHTRDALAARGITYLFVVAPDKHVIYPEFLPASIHPLHPRTRADQLIEAASASGVPVVDLRPALLAAKTRDRVYHRTDTHWNDRGAFAASVALVHALRGRLPGTGPLSRDDLDARTRWTNGLDLAGMLGLTDVLREQDLQLRVRHPRARTIEPARPDPHGIDGRIVTEIPGSRAPRLLMFRDSFGSALVPFLAEDFSHAVFLWQNYLDLDTVVRERPDIVIQEWVGRRLLSLPPYDPGESSGDPGSARAVR